MVNAERRGLSWGERAFYFAKLYPRVSYLGTFHLHVKVLVGVKVKARLDYSLEEEVKCHDSWGKKLYAFSWPEKYNELDV